MKISAPVLKTIFPNTTAAKLAVYVDPLNRLLPFHGFNTPKRVAAFLGQVGHESAGLSVIEENLNYTEKGLLATFAKYYRNNPALAKAHAKNPELIANHVYCSRMGNGDTASGDGYKFRGRGLIQLTGRDNYKLFGFSIDKSINETIEYLETPEGAAESAMWYWKSRKLMPLADAGNMTAITQRINGGQIGAADRLAIYQRALKALA